MPPRRSWVHFSLAALLPAVIAGCAGASRTELASVSQQPFSHPSRPTLAPLAFVHFCMRNGAQCRSTGPAGAVVQATPTTMDVIETVNRQVNARIQPSDADSEWRINPATGNCNDYVVSKRQALLARGFPSSALLISVVKTPSGQGHLVLVIKTNRDDLVLDNLTTAVRSVAETPYIWIKRQTPADPWQWEVV